MKTHCVWRLHLKLEILGDVVEDAEDEDGEDVLVGGPVVGQLKEGVAHRDVALDRDRHRRVDRSCGSSTFYNNWTKFPPLTICRIFTGSNLCVKLFEDNANF